MSYNQATNNKLPISLARFFWHFIKPQFFAFIGLISCYLVWPLQQLGIPYLAKLIIDSLNQNHDDRGQMLYQLIWPITFLAVTWLFLDICFRSYDLLALKVFPVFRARIRMSILHAVLPESYQFFTNQSIGTINAKISNLPKSMELVLNLAINVLFPIFFTCIGSLILLALIHPIFGIIPFIWLTIYFAALWYFGKLCKQKFATHSLLVTALDGKITELITNFGLVKLFNKYQQEYHDLNQYQNQEIQAAQIALKYVFRLKISLGLANFFMLACILYIAFGFWINHHITTGSLTLVMAITANLISLVWIMGLNLFYIIGELGSCDGHLELIRNMSLPATTSDKSLTITSGEIIFNQITFGYPDKSLLFNNFEVTIKPQEKIAIVGLSGSGKTSFINLLLKNFIPFSGQILIDGQSISEVSLTSLYESITVINQDIKLFNRTIRDNICYAQSVVEQEEIIKAAKLANCHDFIMALPLCYDTVIGEYGIKLSAGQRQRITIARAILKDSPIIILDEATSNLDQITAKQIENDLLNLIQAKTAIIVTHDINFAAKLDRILVFENGQIIEQGSHAELMLINNHYRKLYCISNT